jgi:hypothetical protein
VARINSAVASPAEKVELAALAIELLAGVKAKLARKEMDGTDRFLPWSPYKDEDPNKGAVNGDFGGTCLMPIAAAASCAHT